MTALPLRDFTAAEQDRLDAIEAAPAADESVRERVARAIWEADNPSIIEFGWDDYPFEHDEYCRMADAALAVLRGASSDAEQAVERCLTLADEWGEYPASPEAARARELRAAVRGD